MPGDSSSDLNNPFFAWFYRRNGETRKRGEREHRRRNLAGLAGRVVEFGAGDGGNFALYPSGVTEVVAVEPERHLRAHAEAAAAEAGVKVTAVPGLADDLPLEDALVRRSDRVAGSLHRPRPGRGSARAGARVATGWRAALLRARPR